MKLLKKWMFFLMAMVMSCIYAENISNIKNVCEIFKLHPEWYVATKKTQEKWKVPIAVQMAWMHQESGFTPVTEKPYHGYAQATKEEWAKYQQDTGSKGTPYDFAAASDFIGWHSNIVAKKFGVRLDDTYSLYSAYQKGLPSFEPGKVDTNSIAQKVTNLAKTYAQQLKECGK
jgi:hypothetical protein